MATCSVSGAPARMSFFTLGRKSNHSYFEGFAVTSIRSSTVVELGSGGAGAAGGAAGAAQASADRTRREASLGDMFGCRLFRQARVRCIAWACRKHASPPFPLRVAGLRVLSVHARADTAEAS